MENFSIRTHMLKKLYQFYPLKQVDIFSLL
jgi:hypothetical protein